MELEDLKELIDEKFERTWKVCQERCGHMAGEHKKTEAALARIEDKIDEANGRSRHNAWNIKAIWSVFGAAWAVLLIWLRGFING